MFFQSPKSCAYHCVVPCVLLSAGASLNQQVLRQKLGMERAFLRDCVRHTFCNICAVKQEFLEQAQVSRKLYLTPNCF